MAYPAGYSSDEDDLEGFGDEDTSVIRRKFLSVERTNEDNNQLDHLFSSIVNNNVTEVRASLENGLDANLILKDNWSLLLLAASVGNPVITKILIEHGANVNYDRDKYTVLMAACSCPPTCAPPESVLDVVKQLIDKGADVSAITRKRMTALMFACNSGNLEVVRLLLPLSDKFATDNQGWNALFWAVNNNKAEIVQLLLENGFQERQRDVRGNSVVWYAIENGYEEMLPLFPSHKDDAQERFYRNEFSSFESCFEGGDVPPYFNELYGILCGSRSEQMISHFTENGVSLKTFLSITDKELENLGILLPFQRYRILNSLHRFHKHPFKQTSILTIRRNDLYSNIDTAVSVAATVRQIVAMEAAVQYLITNSHMFKNKLDKVLFSSAIFKVHDKVTKVRNVAGGLHQKACQWDYLNSPADLITEQSYKKGIRMKRAIVVSGILLPVIVWTAYKWLHLNK